MGRPKRTKLFYENSDGDRVARSICSISGCSRLRHFYWHKRKDGSKYQFELTTCCRHRKDGGTFRCVDRPRRKEAAWKAQGIILSYSVYQKLLEIQDGKCAICGRPQEFEGRDLSVDHNHKTGEIRGVVCRGCNSAIGWIERFMPLDVLKDYLDSNIMSRYGDILSDI